MIGTITGNMNKGTVSWLNKAKHVKSELRAMGDSSKIRWRTKVTTAIIMEDVFAKKAVITRTCNDFRFDVVSLGIYHNRNNLLILAQ